MKEHKLYFLWALLYALTAGLGFLPNPPEWAKALLILLTIGFFVPGGLLLWNGRKDAHTVHTVLGLSMASLSTSLIFLVANLASTRAGNVVGVALHVLLGVFFRPHVLRTVLGAGTVRLGLPFLRRPGGPAEAEKVDFHCIFCRTLL